MGDLKSYVPTAADPFDATKAAHLLNRAGFGGTPAEIGKVIAMGPRAAVDMLLDFPDQTAAELDEDDLPNFASIQDYPMNSRELARMFAGKPQPQQVAMFIKLQSDNRGALIQIGEWWMKRMARGSYPLQEKLALFWHGHFTTSAGDERLARHMWNQNELLRKYAAGNFGQFVKGISRDPAMLDYLNNQQNRRAHPNENYARELMELFTLGVGHYTETDVKNAARAFTGWGHDGNAFIFRRFDHDTDEKVFLGRRGDFDGDQIVDIILQQPSCAKHIASRFWNFFISEEPNDGVIASLAAVLRENKYDLRPMIRALFTSREFYDPKYIGAQIKSPVQLVVGTVRLLDVDMPPGRMMFQPNSPLNQMGQVPLFPPNVKGWPGGRSWINTSTLFVRYNACVRLAREAKPAAAESPEAAVEAWVSRLIQRPISAEQRKVLLSAVGPKPDRESLGEMIQLIVSMPEYQLC